MKKIVLSIAGVMAATAFAPEASAIPAFARQTGMACSACHMQHYPVLNGFGMAFKSAGYTMMGAQEKIEGEHLSIPATLNAAILLKARYQKSNGTQAAGEISGQTTNSGQWQIPDEFSLFFGGRIAENIGFMSENNMIGGPVGGIAAGFKLPIVLDLGAAKLNVIPFITDALGVAYGFENGSAGMTRGVRWAEHRKEISAMQWANLDGEASGLAIVAITDMGYINLSRWSPNFAFAGGATGIQMSSNYLRVVATPTVGDWALHTGFGVASGSNYTAGGASALETKFTAFDFQAQGNIGGNDTSIYFTYAKVPGTAAGATPNHYNGGVNDKKGWTIGADYSVIPHTLHVGAAVRRADVGGVTDNATTLTAVYDLTQNVALHWNWSNYSGDKYAPAGAATNMHTFMLEAAW